MDPRIKTRQIVVLAVGMFIFTLGFGVIVPVMPYYANRLGATAIDLGLLMATFSAMQFACAPAWGALSDRYGRKPVMMIGLAGFGLSFTMTGLSSEPWALAISEAIGRATGLTPHIGVLFLSEFAGGAISSGIFPATLAYIADISGPGERGDLMGKMGAASGLGIIVGPAISGFLTAWGLTTPFFAAAGIALAVAVLSYFLLPESRTPGRRSGAHKKIPALSVLRTSLGFAFVLALLISFAGAVIDGTFGYFLMGRFGLSDQAAPMPFLSGVVQMTGPGVMGVVFTAMGVTGIVCQGALVGKFINGLGEERTIVIGLAFYSVGLVLIYLASGLLTLALFACLIEMGFGLVFPSLNTLVSKRTDPDHQGAMQGIMGSFNSLGRVLGPPVGGLLFSISIALPYTASAITGFLSAIALAARMTWKKPGESDVHPTSPASKI